MAKATKLDMRGVNAGLKKIHSQEPLVKRRGLALLAVGLNSEAQVASPVGPPPTGGTLKGSHTEDLSNPNAPRIGATAEYAAAVHARHPTNAGWYLNAIVKNAAKFARAALTKALADVTGGGGGGGGGGSGGARRDANGRFIKGSGGGA